MKKIILLISAFFVAISLFAAFSQPVHAALGDACTPANYQTVCLAGGVIYGCKGDTDPVAPGQQGMCVGPCPNDGVCSALTGTGNIWGAATCVGEDPTATPPTVGTCAEAPTTTLSTDITSAPQIIDRLNVIIQWIFAFFILLSIVFIILAGVQFITAGGDPAQVRQARNKLIYAAIGIGVAILSRGFIALLGNVLGL